MEILVFDLDDTLIDTSGSLIPIAAKESCEAMIEAGLNADLSTCLQFRSEFLKDQPKKDVYKSLCLKVTPELENQPEKLNHLVAVGRKAFYQRDLKEAPKLFNQAIETLEYLYKKYKLFLVTAGHTGTQTQKIQLLEIEDMFQKILFADPDLNKTKLDCFSEIQSLFEKTPEAFMSIGNRLDTDIHMAKKIGWKTCYVKYGEYVNMEPSGPNEVPDYEISEIRYLIDVCQL